MFNQKWVRPNLDLYHIDASSKCIITFSNSGKLDKDFYKYACDFYEAAEYIIHYLGEDAARKHDIAKLDLWYFPMVYLYRHSLELLLKAIIFQTVTDKNDRIDIVEAIRHNLLQAFQKIIEIKNLTIDGNANAQWLKDFLSDISQLDSESDMFRYPFGNQFKILFERQTNISLKATHDNMNKAYSIVKELFSTGMFSEQIYEAYEPKLIIEGGHYYQQSVVGYKYSQYSFYPYFSSYNEVGDFLKKTIIAENKSNLFMPTCYLYRNAIELCLKKMIAEDSHIDNDKALKIIRKKKHSVQGLWNSIVEEVKKHVNGSDKDSTLEDLEQYIQTFHNLDNRSDLFRYPCNTKLESYFLTATLFDIENVTSCFEEFCTTLDSIDDVLIAVKEFEEEIKAEMDSYCDY